jgi:outer membrane receptor protein involved in Fe transport
MKCDRTLKISTTNKRFETKAALWIAIAFLTAPFLLTHSARAEETDAAAFSEELGEVRLWVLNADTLMPIPSAVVRIGNVEMGRTDDDGAVTLDLLGGLYHLSVDIGDGKGRTAAIRAIPGRESEIDAELSATSDLIVLRLRNAVSKVPADDAQTVPLTLPSTEVDEESQATESYDSVEELTVTASRVEGSTVDILKEKQGTAKVTEIIGSEQMSKSGDSDAASALKRVTGVTIVDGKYVYVRGLGDRYSSTLLNDLRLPSPDPERRVVPLDMFPSSILESMVIQKTFSPEMPGDFGGGVVNLRTRSYPSEPMFKVELTLGINLGETFEQREFASDQGPTDFLGIDGGHRAIPKELADATKDQKLVTGDRFTEGYTEEEIADISKSMPNNWETEEKRLPPDLGLMVTGGDGFSIKNTKFGFFSSLLYKNEWDATDKTVREYSLANEDTGDLAINNDYRFHDTANTITLGGILALGADFGKGQTIAANTLVDRITDNLFSRYNGFSADMDGDIDVLSYEWTERMLIVQQLMGSHILHPKSKLKLDWRYAFSTATQDQPDKRHTRYDYLDGQKMWVLSSGSDGNRREYITVDEKDHDIGMDLTLPFKQWSGQDASVKAGGAILLKDRMVDLRSFNYENVDSLDLETRALAPELIFVDENFIPGGMALQESTQPTDNYTGTQEVYAGYLSGDLPLWAGLSASGGARFEKSIQEVSTFDVFSLEDEQIKSAIDTFDILPSMVLTYRFKNNMLVRLGYGKTLNRPDFREMSPGCVRSYAGGGEKCGAPTEIPNPDWTTGSEDPRYLPYQLNRTVIHNVDARWEWYFGETGDETLSLGAFYKEFIDPIESIQRASSQKGSILLNADGARDIGIELEFRKNFGFIHSSLEDLYAAANASWIYSSIEIPNVPTLIQTSDKRPLQGQSPYVVNAQLGYDNTDIGLSAALLYNVYGPRISDVGTNGRPDIYEQPFHQLDFVAKKTLKLGFQITLKAKNLIDLPVRFTQGRETTEEYKKGREINLSVSWSY